MDGATEDPNFPIGAARALVPLKDFVPIGTKFERVNPPSKPCCFAALYNPLLEGMCQASNRCQQILEPMACFVNKVHVTGHSVQWQVQHCHHH